MAAASSRPASVLPRRFAPRVGGAGRPGESARVAGAALAVVAFYAAVYPVRGFRVALGSDSPVYVWWADRAAAVGLRSLGSGGRPGTVGTLAALAGVLRVDLHGVVAAAGPALAAAVGLVAAALVELGLDHPRDAGPRPATATLFTGVFLAAMVSGYDSTLAFGACFVAALALLVAGPGRSRTWWLAVSAALVGAGGLAHPLFLGLAGLLVAGALAAMAPAVLRHRDAGPLHRTTAMGLAAAATLGAALTGLGLVAIGPRARAVLDTSRDTLLPRLGLTAAVVRSYRNVLFDTFPWYRGLAVAALAAIGGWALWPRRRERGRVAGEAGRLLAGVALAWVLAAAVGIVALVAGWRVPAQRLAAFCLPVPLLAAAGVRALGREVGTRLGSRGRGAQPGRRARPGRGPQPAPGAEKAPGARPVPDRRRHLGGQWALGALGAVLFVLAFAPGWYGQSPFATPRALVEAQVAGRLLGRQAPGTPLVVVDDDRRATPSLHLTRHLNYVRQAVPPGRLQDVHLFVGTPADLLAGRPTLTGQVEHDRLATDYFRRLRPFLDRRPLAVVLEAFDPRGYRETLGLPAVRSEASRYRPGPGVVVLPPFTGSPASAPLPAHLSRPGPGPFSPWLPVWTAPLVLLLLGVVGWGWVGVARAPRAARVAVAPAVGWAALALASLVVDLAGLRLGSGGAWATLALALGGGRLVGRFSSPGGRRPTRAQGPARPIAHPGPPPSGGPA